MVCGIVDGLDEKHHATALRKRGVNFPHSTESVMGKSMDKDVVYAWAGFSNGGSISCELVGQSRNRKRSKATEL